MKLRILVIILLLLVTSSATLFLMWWSVQEITYPKEIFQEVEEPVLLEVEPLRSTYVNYKIKGWPQGEISDSMFKKRFLRLLIMKCKILIVSGLLLKLPQLKVIFQITCWKLIQTQS